MTNLLSSMRHTALALSLILVGSQAFAETTKEDNQTIEELNKFADENSKLREDHITQMRDLHLKQVNDTYERKMAQNKEMTLLWKQLKPGDKKWNKALHAQIKEKHKAFEKQEKELKEDFKENVLKKKNKEFREIMHARIKEMKTKFKD